MKLSIAVGLGGIALAMPFPSHAQEGALIGVTRAVRIAESVVGGRAMEADLDRERDGRRVYEVDVVRAGGVREVRIAADTGEVIRTGRPGLADWFDAEEIREAARGPALAGLLQALERHSGGEVLDVGFDVERGQGRFEVELSTRAGVAEVLLDSRTGRRLAYMADD